MKTIHSKSMFAKGTNTFQDFQLLSKPPFNFHLELMKQYILLHREGRILCTCLALIRFLCGYRFAIYL